MVVIDVGHSLSYLTAWESSAKLEHVLSDVSVDRGWSLSVQQGVVEVVSTTDDLNIVDVVTVNGWEADTAIVHLSCEN